MKRNKLIITALLTAVSGLTLMQSPALANEVTPVALKPEEYCQYKLAPTIYIEESDCVEHSGGTYSS
jgi:hypothetical protein